MPQQLINIGTVPNDNTGDPLRDAYDKCNQNFTELYAGLPVPLSQLTQSSATTGQVPTWNGSAWAPATPTPPSSGYAIFQPVPSNYAVGITFGSFNAGFTAFTIDTINSTYAVSVLDFTPGTCRVTFTQQETNAANDCDVGFEISAAADFSSVLYTGWLGIGTTFGVRTGTFTVTGLTGGPPYYVRWGYRNPASLPTLNIYGLTLAFS